MRTVGRTAVIAGTASAVSGRVSRRQQQKFAEQEAQAQQAAPPAAAAAAPAADSDELINKLKELATLKDQGVLTEEEFSAQKAKILAQLS
ncbi:MAG TPA: SHOCT domain-containing protein [Acidimicrobiales bacterium]|nr:SHOCT domain-containing protein [Acidimicrobiales bacterium]